MAVDGCGIVCKYILIFFNIIFAVVGFAFLVLGLWLRFGENTRLIFSIEQLNSSAFVIGVTVLIVFGSLMLIVVVFGDYGACNEKRCALQMFSALLFILAAAEIAVGVLAYSQRMEVGARLGEFYVSLYTLYVNTGDPAMAAILAFFHYSFHCCGATGITLIEAVQQTCPKPSGFMEHIIMANCPQAIMNKFPPLVMGVFIGTAALLITALICAVILLQQVKRVHRNISSYYSAVY